MTSYEHMSIEEFQDALNRCESMTDVTTILKNLGTYRVSTDQLRNTKSMTELREVKASADRQLQHLRELSDMCSERMIALAQQHKY